MFYFYTTSKFKQLEKFFHSYSFLSLLLRLPLFFYASHLLYIPIVFSPKIHLICFSYFTYFHLMNML